MKFILHYFHRKNRTLQTSHRNGTIVRNFNKRSTIPWRRDLHTSPLPHLGHGRSIFSSIFICPEFNAADVPAANSLHVYKSPVSKEVQVRSAPRLAKVFGELSLGPRSEVPVAG
jgi:hypothetical protein